MSTDSSYDYHHEVDSIGSLLERAADLYGERPYLIDAGDDERTLTYQQMREVALGLDDFLTDAGVVVGESIATIYHNDIVAAALFVSATACGRRVVPLNPKAGPAEMSAILKRSGVRLIFDQGSSRSGITADDMTEAQTVLADWQFIGTLCTPGARSNSSLRGLSSSGSDAEVVFTSGSSGTPKGVVLSHGALLSNSHALGERYHCTSEDRFLTVCPIFHNSGQIFTTLTPMWWGATSVVARSEVALFKFEHYITKFSITWSLVVNAYLGMLLKRGSKNAVPKGLKGILAGGSRLPGSLIEDFEESYSTRVYQVYGLTETTSIATSEVPDSHVRSVGGAGIPLSIGQISIAGTDHSGEILFKGSNLFDRYLDQPELTASALIDGWLHTGDIGHLDATGNLHITDRLDNLVIIGGENVYPSEIEVIVPHLADIAEMVALGVDGGILGSTLYLVYEAMPDTEPDTVSMRKILTDHISTFKVPQHMISVKELGYSSIPRGENGKVLRKQLKDKLVSHLSERSLV